MSNFQLHFSVQSDYDILFNICFKKQYIHMGDENQRAQSFFHSLQKIKEHSLQHYHVQNKRTKSLGSELWCSVVRFEGFLW